MTHPDRHGLSVAAMGAALLLSACAQVPERQAPPAAAVPAAAKAAVAPRVEPLPAMELTPRILYQALIAEIAGQRGDMALSASAYLELARATRDPRFARRAGEIALHARDLEGALNAARLWVGADPDSAQARQMLASLLVSANRLDEAFPHVASVLAQEMEQIGEAMLRLNRLFARHPDKAAVLIMVERLTLPYGGIAEAHFARAQAALSAAAWQRGIAEAAKAVALRPDWEEAVLLKAQLEKPEVPEQALETLRGYLGAYPKAREVRLQYARNLVGARRYEPARAEFQRLLDAFPDDVDIIYAVAILSSQLNDWDVAEANFRKLLTRDFADIDAVRLYLGQIAEERKQPAEAMQWYALVKAGDQHLAARIRTAQLLSRQGRLDEARQQLRDAAAANPAERMQMVLGEAQLLRDAGQLRAAFDLLDGHLSAQPEQPDLLYESALLAERIGRTDLLEARLRTLMRLKPEHAHAYNALGYALADRNERLDEAQQLIVRALSFAPDDPFILDSMGWVLFRRGDNAGALTYLQRAYAIRADAEIAAHLGEVLWLMDRRGEARRIWREAARATPGNELLGSVMKRLDP